MIYALCFDTNTVYCFRSEREASAYCREHAGDWQLCDERGQAIYPPGFSPRMQVGLLAAHVFLADMHESGNSQPSYAPDSLLPAGNA
ncbi:hypothetical protein [Chitinimonas sp. BJYL2]|uniref:hypothetical protein n=1 Tax=Chitinimonas sp. BJYL2 TaxID=2976696 RepID=UPI0022B4C0B1|nr:hypothetical protein [Chitinimonas sp. BJYL2]